MTREEVFQLVAEMDNLPKLPHVAMKLMEMGMDDQVAARDIAAIVMEDPAITAYLLKLINSPFYGLREKVTTVSHAIALLGVDVVRNIVLSLAVLDIMKHRAAGNPALRNYWEQSLYTAVSARLYAQLVNYPSPEKAFIAGLLADLGCLVLWEIDSVVYKKVLRKDDSGRGDRSLSEKAFFGVDHTEAGVALARFWNLPEEYIGVIALHHNLEVLQDLEDDSIKTLAGFVHLGSVVGSIFIRGEDGFKTEYLKTTANVLYGLPAKMVDSLLLRASKQLEELLADADLGPLTKKSYFKILQDSNKKLGENNLELTRRLMEQEHLTKARRELMTMVSEDLKSPLSAIIGYSSHLVGLVPEEKGEMGKLLRQIYDSGKKALLLINEYEKLVNAGDETFQVSPKSSDVGSLLTELLEMVADRAARKNIHIVSKFHQPLPWFVFDRHKLGHALAHLLNLVMILVGDGGEIELRTDVITIPAKIPGVAASTDRLFELRLEELRSGNQNSRKQELRRQFKQPDKITRFADHLADSGFYLARSIINAHGGQVQVNWRDDDRISMVVHLPLPSVVDSLAAIYRDKAAGEVA